MTQSPELPAGPLADPGTLPLPLRQTLGWYAIRALTIGHRTGLLGALLHGPGSAREIAARAGVDERNALEWLRAGVAAGHTEHHDGTFTASDELAQAFHTSAELDFRALLDVCARSADLDDDVVRAVRTGTGLGPARYAHLSEAGGRINTPLYRDALVHRWLSAVPDLLDRLASGIRVAELASGGGEAAIAIGRAFPASTIVAFDIVAPPAPGAPPNVRLRQGDVRSLSEDGPFDLVYALDSFHHFGAPRPVLDEVRRVLAPDGILLLAESTLTGDLDTDRHDPSATIAFTAGLFYCLQENLAAGGDGRTGGDGTDWILEELQAAGFHHPHTHQTDEGFTLLWTETNR